MHFWIDKRSSSLHHYGRRPGRPGPGGGFFYGGTHTANHPPPHRQSSNNVSSAVGTTNSKTTNNSNSNNSSQHPQNHPHSNNTVESSAGGNISFYDQHPHHHQILRQQQQMIHQQSRPSSSALTFNNLENSGVEYSSARGVMVTPVHRFAAMEVAREQAQLACRLTFASSNAAANNHIQIQNAQLPSVTANGVPNSMAAAANNPGRRSLYGGMPNQASRSRSQSRDRSSSRGSIGRQSRRRSSGSRIHSHSIPSDDSVTPSELQQLTTGTMLGQPPSEDQSPGSPPLTGGDLGSATSEQQPQIHLLHGDTKWNRTKGIGLTLCFMAFILLGVVATKFIIQGPSLIDTHRRGQSEETASFFFSELLFVAFAMALFFTGVACLRNRTNDYLLRQFNQHILSTSARAGVGAGAMGDFIDYYDTLGHAHHNGSGGLTEDEENQDNMFLQQHHHHHPHSHPNELLFSSDSDTRAHHSAHHHHHHHNHSSSNNCRHSSHFNVVPDALGLYGNSSSGGHRGRSSHSGRQGGKPPPYHIALYLPLPSQDEPDTIQSSCTVAISDKNSADGEQQSPQEKGDSSVKETDLPETPPPSYCKAWVMQRERE